MASSVAFAIARGASQLIAAVMNTRRWNKCRRIWIFLEVALGCGVPVALTWAEQHVRLRLSRHLKLRESIIGMKAVERFRAAADIVGFFEEGVCVSLSTFDDLADPKNGLTVSATTMVGALNRIRLLIGAMM